MGIIFGIIIFLAVGYMLWKNRGTHPDIFKLVEGEKIVEIVKSDYWEKSLLGSKQNSGELALTNKRVLFKGTILSSCHINIALDYHDMASINPSLTPPCFPFGITITTKSGESYKFAVLKRKHYFNLISSLAKKAE